MKKSAREVDGKGNIMMKNYCWGEKGGRRGGKRERERERERERKRERETETERTFIIQ